MNVDVNNAVRQLTAGFAFLSPRNINLAVSRAINRSISTVRSAVNKDIRGSYNIRSRDLNKALTIKKSTSKTLSGMVAATGAFLPIYAFKPRQTKAGVSFTIKKGKRVRIKKAFIQTLTNGHKGVFARGQYKTNTFSFRKKRIVKTGSDLPIGELNTVSIPGAFQDKAIMKRTQQLLGTTFEKRLLHELQYMASTVATP